jgi:chemotaxis protein methyltransferase CheR
MMEKISDPQLERITDMVARHLGLHFPRERWPDLRRGIYGAAQESGRQDDLPRYVEELLSPTREQTQVLASHLTVGETYFFRENRSLKAFEKYIVPELIRTRTDKAIRVWSAGCATGEEPYSIAITLGKLTPVLEKWDVQILATDLNSKSLQKASEGIYAEWSFRGVPSWVRSAYFEAIEKDRWAIANTIKRMVSFAQFNLMEDLLPPHSDSATDFDVIFCRNVLMYFTPAGTRKAVRQLYRFLANDGWLIVSPTETSHELFSEFAAVSFGDVTLYRKAAAHPGKTLISPFAASGENGSGLRLFEQSFENSETAMAQFCDSTQLRDGGEAHSANAEELSLLNGQAPALHQAGHHADVPQATGTPPSQTDDSKNNDAQAMLRLARECANEGQLAAALVWCDKAIAADKMAARAYYLRATILQEQGSLSDAVFAFRRTVYVEPQFVLGHFSLGSLALNFGKPRESEKYFENVLLLLAQYEPEDIVPESEGLSAGRLREMIVSSRGDRGLTASAKAWQRAFLCAGEPHAAQGKSR